MSSDQKRRTPNAVKGIFKLVEEYTYLIILFVCLFLHLRTVFPVFLPDHDISNSTQSFNCFSYVQRSFLPRKRYNDKYKWNSNCLSFGF